MVEVLLGEMLFDHESLNHFLNLVDRLIGKQYKDFNLIVNQGQGFLKIVGRCRSCKRLIRSEQNYNVTGWAERLIDVFVVEADTHHARSHKSLILGGNAIGNAIHCDICKSEAGTDATEQFNSEGRSIWVCNKCEESAVRRANSFSIGT